MRGIAAALALLLSVGSLVGLGYVVGVRRGVGIARRWAPVVEDLLRWRRVELQGDTLASDELLQQLRTAADREELRRDRRYVELED